jgi:tetratricopeptide (TPR) repeat protein
MVAENLGGLGNVFIEKEDFSAGEKMFFEALEINKEIGCMEGMAKQYANLGMLYLRRNSETHMDLQRSEKMFSESQKINAEVGGKEGIAVNCLQQGMIAMKVENYRLARNMLADAARLHNELGNQCAEADCLGRLGDCYVILGNSVKAEDCYTDSLRIFQLMEAHPQIEEIEQALKNLKRGENSANDENIHLE